jgi:hypothetical protein
MDRVNPNATEPLAMVQPLLEQGKVADATFETFGGMSGVPTSMTLRESICRAEIFRSSSRTKAARPRASGGGLILRMALLESTTPLVP